MREDEEVSARRGKEEGGRRVGERKGRIMGD